MIITYVIRHGNPKGYKKKLLQLVFVFQAGQDFSGRLRI